MREGSFWIEYNLCFPFTLSRGGKYSEDDAKVVLVQILNVVALCHIQGVFHRDLKPEVKWLLNFRASLSH